MTDCGHNNPFSHRYCVVCGDALERICCPQCGKQGSPSFLYCAACGYSLKQPIQNSAHAQSTPTVSADKANLNELLELLAIQQQQEQSSIQNKPKMSQADIKALLKNRKKS